MMQYAWFNVTTDRLYWHPEARLSDDEYKHVKTLGWTWWPRGVFTAIWNPVAEDYLTGLGLEIAEDDTPDDLDARIDKYQKHADNASERAEHAEAAVTAIVDGIPFGQPILVSHHSERHARSDQKRIESGMRTIVAESEKAVYWQRRIDGSIRNAAHKDAPGTIARRIKGLEADLRKWQRTDADEDVRQKQGWYYSDWTTLRKLSYDLKWNQCTIEQQSDFQVWAAARRDRAVAWAQRWIEHLEMRLAYERAYLAAVGGLPDLAIEVGGAVYSRGSWGLVLKINRQTVEVRERWYQGKVDKTKIKQAKSKAEIAVLSDDDFMAFLDLPVKWRTM